MGTTTKAAPYKESPDMLQHAGADNAEATSHAPRNPKDTTRGGGRKFTPEQIKAAKRRVARYQSWRGINGQAYRFAERLALEEAANKRRVSGQWLVAQIRAKDIVDDQGNPCRPNNDYAPLIVRELIANHPEVANLVERRTAIYDRLLATGGDAE
ncbi:MAG: hypothetical protein PUE02_02395 [Eggerthellaceae bacterium]|nr:hypothetical protein [Eggerthellaceae bacterium]